MAKDKSKRNTPQPPKPKTRKPSPPCTQSLGDALLRAGVTAKKKK